MTLVSVASFASPPVSPWGGGDCVSRATLRAAVDQALAAAPAAEALGSGFGSGAPGYSVAVTRVGCGTFRYAVGLRDVEQGKPMHPRARLALGSLTKALTAVVLLRLEAGGFLGPDGLATPVDHWLTAADRETLGPGPPGDTPRCPADILTLDRDTGTLRPVLAECPDFSRITLRHLLDGNHGLFDLLNEVDRDRNGLLDSDQLVLASLFEALGIPRTSLPAGTDSGFELLAALGVLANPDATVGGSRRADFETSFGNTGYTLAGVVAERATGVPLGRLLRLAVGRPLRIPLRLLTKPPTSEGLVARQYLVTTGNESVGLPADLFGAYPLVSIHGNPAINTYALDAYAVTNGAGGAGAAATTPTGYLRFFEALVGGTLLEPTAQAHFDGPWVPIDELPGVTHGFGLFRFDDPEFGPGYAKSGRVTGSVCQLLHFTEPRTTVVACRNSADAFLGGTTPPSSAPVGDLARQLVRLARETTDGR